VVPNATHFLISIQLRLKQGFKEPQTRAQKQGDFMDNFIVQLKLEKIVWKFEWGSLIDEIDQMRLNDFKLQYKIKYNQGM
jgi:hypothetical protein